MSILQNKKTRIGIGVASVAVAAAALGAGTFAAFSDTETGPSGTVASGTLDLEVGASGSTDLLNVANIQPGWKQTATYTVKNAGSLAGALSNSLALTSENVTCTEPEREAEGTTTCAGNLQDQVTVSVLNGPGVSAATPAVSVKDLATGGKLPGGGTIGAGQTASYQLQFEFPDLGGTENNKAQGDKLVLSSNFVLNQTTQT